MYAILVLFFFKKKRKKFDIIHLNESIPQESYIVNKSKLITLKDDVI